MSKSWTQPGTEATAGGARTSSRYDALRVLVKKSVPCSKIVEIGTWNGARAQELSVAALRRNASVAYHGFDLFELQTDEDFEKELSKRPPSEAAVSGRLEAFRQIVNGPWRPWVRAARGWRPWLRRQFEFHLYKGYTRDTLPRFAQEHRRTVDFVFIDGGHSIETIENDWNHAAELVRVGGTIVLDDFYDKTELTAEFGCNFLLERLRNDPQWDVTLLHHPDIIPKMGGIRLLRVRLLESGSESIMHSGRQ